MTTDHWHPRQKNSCHMSCHSVCQVHRTSTSTDCHFIHCCLQSAWPSLSSCAGSLHQRSHTALALAPCARSELLGELQSSHPEGRMHSALWHNQQITITFTILELLFPFPSLARTWNKLTNTPSVTSLTHLRTIYYLEMLMNNIYWMNKYCTFFYYKGVHRVRWIMFTSLISQNYFNCTPQVRNEVATSLNWHY